MEIKKYDKLTINHDHLITLGFRKSCNMYLKGGMSLSKHKGYVWIASYKTEPTEDVHYVGELLRFMKNRGINILNNSLNN